MSDCIFCKIIEGEIPSQKVLETDNLIVIKDIKPDAPIHDLIIPKKHISSLNELDDKEIASEIVIIAKDVAEKEGIKGKGYRLIVNTGKDGGQLIGHLHFHLLGGKKLPAKLAE